MFFVNSEHSLEWPLRALIEMFLAQVWCSLVNRPLPNCTRGVYGSTNSRPYRGAASNILFAPPYAGSFAGGNVIAGAGTPNSLNHASNPAGVTRISIRYCSDSMVNE